MSGERIVVHRIAYRRRRDRANAVVITRGDAMIVPDPPVAAAEILGYVREFDAGSGWQPVGPPVGNRDAIVFSAARCSSRTR